MTCHRGECRCDEPTAAADPSPQDRFRQALEKARAIKRSRVEELAQEWATACFDDAVENVEGGSCVTFVEDPYPLPPDDLNKTAELVRDQLRSSGITSAFNQKTMEFALSWSLVEPALDPNEVIMESPHLPNPWIPSEPYRYVRPDNPDIPEYPRGTFWCGGNNDS